VVFFGIFVIEDVEVSDATGCSRGFGPGLTGLMVVAAWLMDAEGQDPWKCLRTAGFSLFW
jgi:hypothetical protein